jgi:hypothetical protein
MRVKQMDVVRDGEVVPVPTTLAATLRNELWPIEIGASIVVLGKTLAQVRGSLRLALVGWEGDVLPQYVARSVEGGVRVWRVS